MRQLLTIGLWFASTILVFGDEHSKPIAVETPSALPSNEEGTKAKTTEWHPRLMLVLSMNGKVPLKPLKHFPNDTFNDGASELKVPPGEFATLYCDTVTLNSSEDGDTSSYDLECKSRVRIFYNGATVDADSASLKDGKCELLNATFTCGVVTATAQQLTFPVHLNWVSTSTFGSPIPKSPPKLVIHREVDKPLIDALDDKPIESRPTF